MEINYDTDAVYEAANALFYKYLTDPPKVGDPAGLQASTVLSLLAVARELRELNAKLGAKDSCECSKK